jgi:hypothetical protein
MLVGYIIDYVQIFFKLTNMIFLKKINEKIAETHEPKHTSRLLIHKFTVVIQTLCLATRRILRPDRTNGPV